MTKKRWAGAAFAALMAQGVFAGGINTNTNMSVAFDRTLSRDAVLATDGVYFQPRRSRFPGSRFPLFHGLAAHHPAPLHRQLVRALRQQHG